MATILLAAAVLGFTPGFVLPPLSLLPTYTTLQSGLGGAIGSHYLEDEGRVYFVEYSGKLSSYDVRVRLEGSQWGSLSRTLSPETSLNLVDGTSNQGGHIRWDTALGSLLMRPQGNCRLAALERTVSYWSVTAQYLDTLSYSTTGLDASKLEAGMTFAVKNNYRQAAADFDYAKVYVSSYSATSIRLLVSTYKLEPRYIVHGTGYSNPEDVVVTKDRTYLYVTERSGSLVRVVMAAANKDRSNAAAVRVVRSGLGALHQMSLNDDESRLYVVEYGSSGRLLEVKLDGWSYPVTTLRSGLQYAVGLVTRDDGNEAFITLQGSSPKIVRFVASSGTLDDLPIALPSLFFMTWADESKQDFFVTQRSTRTVHFVATNSIVDATYTTLSGTVPALPSSVAVLNPTELVVCTDDYLVKKSYNTAYTSSGPLLLGIGHVPKTEIVSGYATTDPGYFFKVKDAPFGGKMNIMVNHEKARAMGARYYKVFRWSTQLDDAFADYLWVNDKFVLRTTAPSSSGFFAVRRNEDLWYNAHLGYILDSTRLPSGLARLRVRFYSAMNDATEVAVDDVLVQIDNTRPTAAITNIYQVVNGVKTPVPACGIVEGSSDEFSFDISVEDDEDHLLSWSLATVWGDSKSAGIASDSYEPNHVSATRKWAGGSITTPAGNWHATVLGDPSSRRCARTFTLKVWDRTINGYNYIHRAVATKSITLLLS